MNLNKKTILISFALVIAVLAIFLKLMFPSATTKPTAPTSQNQPGVNLFPVSEEQKKQQSAEIRTKFQNFLSEQAYLTQEKPVMLYPLDSKNTPISLNVAFPALGLEVPAVLKSDLSQEDYEFFYCVENGKKEIGMSLHAVYLDASENMLVSEVLEQKMKLWEKDMLFDLHAVLYPNISFSSEQLKQPLEFNDGASRYAQITLPNGQKSSLNYRLSNDTIFLATSLDCVNKGADTYRP